MYVALTVLARQNWADALVALGVRAVCLSYLQLAHRKTARKVLEAYKSIDAWVMLDSGALQVASDSMEDLEKHLEKYVGFVSKNQDLLDCWTELDAVSHVPYETVAGWREKWKEAGLTERLVVAYHGNPDVLDGTHKHISLPSGEPDSYYSKFFRDNFAGLRENGTRVYGRGVTRAAVLQLPWYAVDSTTWSAWGRWGHIYFWNSISSRLEVFLQPDTADMVARNELRIQEFDRRGAWEKAQDHGLSDGLRTMDGHAVDRWNALQWIELQKHLETQVGNSYWLTEEEKRELVARRRDMNRAAMVVSTMPSAFAGELSIGDSAPPALQVGRYCDSCLVSDKCPVYRPGMECNLSQLRPIHTKDDMVSAIQGLLALQYDRVQFAAMMERLHGGGLDKDVTQNMQMFMDMLVKLKQLSSSQEEVAVTVKGPGIISRMFGGLIEDAKRGVAQRAMLPVPASDVVTIDERGEKVDDGE